MNRRNNLILFGSIAGMLVIIFDSKTAITGASEGISLCLHTLIPALFPFFVISGLITSSLTGQPITLLKPIKNVCHIAEGSESLFAIGILGGYPVGAGSIHTNLKKGCFDVHEASRLASFCNNAGPSFIFGVLGPLFPDLSWPCLLWLIQVLSAILAGAMLNNVSDGRIVAADKASVRIIDCVNRAIRNMGAVCAWVILFRMVLQFGTKWFLQYLPPVINVLVAGALELSNGCLELNNIGEPYIRFFLATILLSLGGICVLMQTIAVFPELDIKVYLKGRFIHLTIAIVLSSCFIFFKEKNFAIASLLPTLFFSITICKRFKKEVAIP